MFVNDIDCDKKIEFICNTDWDDIVNLQDVRKGLKKGGVLEIQTEGKPCVLISKHEVLCNRLLLEYVCKLDNMLFIKIKKTVD